MVTFMKYWKYFRLEFWLSLPLLGLVFWLFCSWMTQELLINLSNDDIKLEVSVKPKNQSLYFQEFSSIVLQVNSGKGFSIVTVTKEIRGEETKGVKKIEFQLFTTDLQEIEAEIAKELELSPRKVRKLLVN